MMTIPKYPKTPVFTDEQIRALTNIVFLEKEVFQYQSKYDLIFVFGVVRILKTGKLRFKLIRMDLQKKFY